MRKQIASSLSLITPTLKPFQDLLSVELLLRFEILLVLLSLRADEVGQVPGVERRILLRSEHRLLWLLAEAWLASHVGFLIGLRRVCSGLLHSRGLVEADEMLLLIPIVAELASSWRDKVDVESLPGLLDALLGIVVVPKHVQGPADLLGFA